MASEFWCNLVIPGAAKSGTSSLHDALNRHPDICMSLPKEPQFFSFSERYSKGAEVHNRLFSGGADTVIFGESSQCYFTHECAIDRIVSSLHGPKAIIMLREPIERLLSQYAWNYRRGTETDELGTALRSRGEETGYIYDQRIRTFREIGGYLAFSRYSRWVPEWQRRLGNANVLLLRFEDFKLDQQAVLQRCLEFLGVKIISLETQAYRNATEATFTKVLPSHIFAAARLVPPALKQSTLYRKLVQKARAAYTPQPRTELIPSMRRFLEEELAEDLDFHSAIPAATPS